MSNKTDAIPSQLGLKELYYNIRYDAKSKAEGSLYGDKVQYSKQIICAWFYDACVILHLLTVTIFQIIQSFYILFFGVWVFKLC